MQRIGPTGGWAATEGRPTEAQVAPVTAETFLFVWVANRLARSPTKV